jgi:polysaccharide deacetylase 2 family uncharacterized protein YibQ
MFFRGITVNEHLRRAMEALENGVTEVRAASADGAGQVRSRLHQTVEEVLVHLERDQEEPEPEDTVGRLDRQSREIAEELRRVERLMRERGGLH